MPSFQQVKIVKKYQVKKNYNFCNLTQYDASATSHYCTFPAIKTFDLKYNIHTLKQFNLCIQTLHYVI